MSVGLYVASLSSIEPDNGFDMAGTAARVVSQLVKPANVKEIGKRRLFDCDANLTHDLLKGDVRNLLRRASEQAFLSAAVVPGSNLKDTLEAINLAQDDTLRKDTSVELFATAGVHPYYSRGEVPKDFSDKLGELLLRDRVVAVGECGLDTSDGFPPIEEQLSWFRVQLDIACQLDKPLFLHERNAHEPFLNELRSRKSILPSKVLVHCFTGTDSELMTYLEEGFYISISGLICRSDKEGKRFQKVIQTAKPPASRLMVETDAPYMQFPGCRKHADTDQWKDRPNVPSSIIQIAEKVSKVLERDVEDVIKDSYAVAKTFFSLKM